MQLSAKDLKVGDFVRRPCWKVNGPFYEVGKIEGGTVWVKVPPSDYLVSYDNIHDWEKKSTPIPLYSEKEAVAFLTEKGYSVQAPPEPLKGKAYILQWQTGVRNIFVSNGPFEHRDAKLVAIVDWTEGQGLSPKSS